MKDSFYLKFSRKKWTYFHQCIPKIFKKEIIKKINKKISLKELNDIYLPLSYLLNFHVKLHAQHQLIANNMLSSKKKIPYIISIAGSVAVGKSTIANILQNLLKLWPTNNKVELITTDAFLHSNYILKKRGLMHKKGFPQSYNKKKLIKFIALLKAGAAYVSSPIYSHLNYDILPNTEKIITTPDIVILEGLNVLQGEKNQNSTKNNIFVSHFVDFSIYVHAESELIKNWYVNRFLNFRRSAFMKPNSYFHEYVNISEKKAKFIATQLWKKINWINLKKNILPTRNRANLIIKKSIDHTVTWIKLRKFSK